MNLFKNKRIMVVVAHPDDEVLGLGGSMHRLVKNDGSTTKVIILGEGLTSRSDKRDTDKWKTDLKKHKENIREAAASIGYHEFETYDYPDNRFDSVDLLDIIKTVEKEKAKFKPEIIFTHHAGDTNIDHRVVFESVITACRPIKGESCRTILTFETPSSTEWQAFDHPRPFMPNFHISLSQEDVDAKIKAMESYNFEKREFPHPRSPKALQALAQKRGVEIGHPFAEAFVLIRNII